MATSQNIQDFEREMAHYGMTSKDYTLLPSGEGFDLVLMPNLDEDKRHLALQFFSHYLER